MRQKEPDLEAAFRTAMRLSVRAFLLIGMGMVWLWDTMSRQSCASHPATVVWKGIKLCASANQALLWHIGSVALVAVILAPLGTKFIVKAWRRRR